MFKNIEKKHPKVKRKIPEELIRQHAKWNFILAISLDDNKVLEKNEGINFAALLDKINEVNERYAKITNQNTKGIIVIADTLNRHYFNKKESSDKTILGKSKKLGDDWLQRNKAIYQQFFLGRQPVQRWEQWVNDPLYPSARAIIDLLTKNCQSYLENISILKKNKITRHDIDIFFEQFKKNANLKLQFGKAASLEKFETYFYSSLFGFIKRRTKDIKFISNAEFEKIINFSFEYLCEEMAVMQLVCPAYGYKIVYYTGAQLSAFRGLDEIICLLDKKNNFEQYSQKEVELFNKLSQHLKHFVNCSISDFKNLRIDFSILRRKKIIINPKEKISFTQYFSTSWIDLSNIRLVSNIDKNSLAYNFTTIKESVGNNKLAKSNRFSQLFAKEIKPPPRSLNLKPRELVFTITKILYELESLASEDNILAEKEIQSMISNKLTKIMEEVKACKQAAITINNKIISNEKKL